MIEAIAPSGYILSPNHDRVIMARARDHIISQFIFATGVMSTLAGTAGEPGYANGVGSAARFRSPSGATVTPDGRFIIVADTGNNSIRLLTVATGEVITLVDSSARFISPMGVAIRPNLRFIIVADTGNHAIQIIDSVTRTTLTLAGKAGESGSADGIGSVARFRSPSGVGITPDGQYIIVADTGNHLVRKIVYDTGDVSTLAGKAGEPGNVDGVGSTARFSSPASVTITPDGSTVIIADSGNKTTRQIDLATGAVSTVVFNNVFLPLVMR
jgi:DNA-binding beta-propeller fold protein YncE